jgi:hypothetical protein
LKYKNLSATLQDEIIILNNISIQKGKAVLATGRGGPCGCETSRLPQFVDNWLIDGGKVVSVTHWPLFTPQEDSWYSFLLRG